MELFIRSESSADFQAVKYIHDLTFGNNAEGILVEKLRGASDFVPGLSIVAETNGKVVGHALFYPIKIRDGNTVNISLSLAPVSVHPAYQKRGIGKAMIREGIERAKSYGYRSVIVIGHAGYYAKFGFQKASVLGIRSAFNVPEDAFMAIELEAEGLKGVKGIAEYPEQFFSVSIAGPAS